MSEFDSKCWCCSLLKRSRVGCEHPQRPPRTLRSCFCLRLLSCRCAQAPTESVRQRLEIQHIRKWGRVWRLRVSCKRSSQKEFGQSLVSSLVCFYVVFLSTFPCLHIPADKIRLQYSLNQANVTVPLLTTYRVDLAGGHRSSWRALLISYQKNYKTSRHLR